MTSDEPTIGQLHNLDGDDPWDRRSDEVKQAQAAYEAQLQEILKDVPARNEPSGADGKFDFPDNEDMTIGDEPGRYYRITAPGRKLAEICNQEPRLSKLCLVMRNNANGCWMALTSLRVAQKLANSLGTGHELEVIDHTGTPAS